MTHRMDLTRSRLPVGDLRSPHAAASDAAVLAAAFMLAAAALVHLALTPEHFAAWWVFGALFAAAAGLQLVTAIVLLRSPGRAPRSSGPACSTPGSSRSGCCRARPGCRSGRRRAIPRRSGWMDAMTTVDELLLIALLSIEAGWTACSRGGRVSHVCRGSGIALAIVLTLAFAGGVGHV